MGCHIGVIYFTRRLYERYKISIRSTFTVNKKDGDTTLSRDLRSWKEGRRHKDSHNSKPEIGCVPRIYKIVLSSDEDVPASRGVCERSPIDGEY